MMGCAQFGHINRQHLASLPFSVTSIAGLDHRGVGGFVKALKTRALFASIIVRLPLISPDLKTDRKALSWHSSDAMGV